jgi:uncharacterized protein (TIGR00156 family)
MQKLWYLLPLTLLLILLFGASVVNAQGAAGNGSQDRSVMQSQKGQANSAPVTSANGVAAAKDDQPVKLRGRIVSQQGKNQYVFADDTGNAVVEIGNKVLNGQSLIAGTDVEIQGEVDRGFIRKQPKVEAKSVTVLASSSGSPSSSPGGFSAPNKAQPESPVPEGSSRAY